MTKLGIAKLVINYAVGTSTTYVVGSIITNNIDPETTQEKIEMTIGAVAIGSLVAAHTKAHVNNGVDKVVDAWQNRKDVKNATETVVESVA